MIKIKHQFCYIKATYSAQTMKLTKHPSKQTNHSLKTKIEIIKNQTLQYNQNSSGLLTSGLLVKVYNPYKILFYY